MADVPFAFIRDMMAAALGVEAHLLRPPYKDAQEFDYRLSRILRADFDYKDIFSAGGRGGRGRFRTFSAQAPCTGWRKAPCTMCTIRWS